jgi:hypothetical protein
VLPSGCDKFSTTQNLSAEPTTDITPSELWHFPSVAWKDFQVSQRPRSFPGFLYELFGFELVVHIKALTPPEIYSFRILEGFFNSCASAEYSHVLKSVIHPELSCSFNLQGKLSSSFLSPSDGEFRCPPGYPSPKQPISEPIRVFSNPVKIPQWTLPSEYRTQRVIFSCACLHTYSMPS